MNFFIALHRSELQKGTMAYMERKSTSNTIRPPFVLDRLGYSDEKINNKTISPMEMYRYVIISLMNPMTLSNLLCCTGNNGCVYHFPGGRVK